MQVHLIIAGLAGVSAFLCLIMAMSHETHTIPARHSRIDRSTLWSCGALGLMLLSLGAFAAGA
jgi:hypothetical protein